MVTQVVKDAEAAAVEAARRVEMVAEAAITERGEFNFAVSGGRTPWRMLELLAEDGLNWSRTSLFQVDERVAPTGSDQRNLTHLVLTLPLACQAAIRPMPVGADDLESAARSYEYSLPDRFDLIHLGLGPDGHIASLIPGDSILGVRDRRVALTTGEYQGTRRMSLTYEAIDQARQILFLVTGEEKRDALIGLTAADASIPAGRIENSQITVITDVETPTEENAPTSGENA